MSSAPRAIYWFQCRNCRQTWWSTVRVDRASRAAIWCRLRDGHCRFVWDELDPTPDRMVEIADAHLFGPLRGEDSRPAEPSEFDQVRR